MHIPITCPQGHQWRVTADDYLLAGSGQVACPVCGTVVDLASANIVEQNTPAAAPVPAAERLRRGPSPWSQVPELPQPRGVGNWMRRSPFQAMASAVVVIALLAGLVLAVKYALDLREARINPPPGALSAVEARDHGVELCEKGEVSLGMLWLARGLQIAPAHSAELQRSIRTHLAGWARQSNAPRAILSHEDMVVAVAFSPDGKTVLTGSRDNTARLWEVATGKPRGKAMTHKDTVRAVAFSPNGKYILTGSDDHTARLWEVESSEPIGQPMRHQDAVQAVAFSPDGKLVLTGGDDRTARLWRATTGEPVGQPMAHQDLIYSVAFRPDGKAVLTASADRTARLWDTATQQPLAPPIQHPEMEITLPTLPGDAAEPARARQAPMLRTAAFSPDGKLVVTGGDDRTARLWDAVTGQPFGAPMPHQEWVQVAAFSPDSKTLLTGSWDGAAQLWEVDSQKPNGPRLEHKHWVMLVGFSADGKAFLTGSDVRFGARGQVRIWETETGKPLGNPLEHKGRLSGAAFSPDGNTVVTGSWDRTARLWEAAPVQGEVERLVLWTQVNAGMELDASGTARKLDAGTLAERRERLLAMGGPPLL